MKSFHYKNKVISSSTAEELYYFPGKIIKGEGSLSGISGIPANRTAIIAGGYVMKNFSGKIKKYLASAPDELIFAGEATPAEIFRLKTLVVQKNIKTIIAAGGGKCMDTCKIIRSDLKDIYLAAVPTSPATCAAFTQVSVIYDKDGKYQDTIDTLPPDLLVIDYEIMRRAPEAFFAAGAVDALAKYYEAKALSPGRGAAAISGILTVSAAKNVADRILKIAEKKLSEYGLDEKTRNELVDINILHSGLVSSEGKYSKTSSAAHAAAYAMTASCGARAFLHGEHVGMGLVLQEAALKNTKNLEKIENLLGAMDIPARLKGFGIKEKEMKEVTGLYFEIKNREKIAVPIDDKLMYNIFMKYYGGRVKL